MTDTIDSLKQQLAQLQARHARSATPKPKWAAEQAALERRILDLVMAAPATAVQPGGVAAARPSGWLLSGLGLAVLSLAAAGYLWKGTPVPAMGNGTEASAADGSGGDTTNAEQIAAMTEKLAQRLQDKPDDVEGWSMLARSYSVLGRHAEALKAFAKASSLRPNDAALLADHADSLAVNSNNDLAGEPMKLVQRALQIDPQNLKALYLSGTYDFNKQDYAGAIRQWQKLAEVGPPGNVFVREVESAIAEARRLAGLPAAPKPLDAAAAVGAAGAAGVPGSAAAPTGAAGKGTVSGTVTLSAAMAQQAQPDDTVFVFARAAQGSRMPLAILRKQVRDLPLRFSLDDSMAMSPASALSSASQVIVAARISKSGNAMPQPGDLLGQSQPVDVGASGLQIEIRETVKP